MCMCMCVKQSMLVMFMGNKVFPMPRRLCVHGSRGSECVKCGGGNICSHAKRRHRCAECLTIEQRANNNHFCKCCLDKYLTMRRRRAQIQLCAKCDSGYVKRTEEIVRPLILLDLPAPSGADDLVLGGVGCDAAKRRPDLVWMSHDRVIFLEIDENGGHPDRLPSCELAKVWDQTTAVQTLINPQVAIYFLRMNPDACDRFRIGLEARCQIVAKEIDRLLHTNIDQTHIQIPIPKIGYFFYHTQCQFQIDAALANPDSVSVYMVV